MVVEPVDVRERREEAASSDRDGDRDRAAEQTAGTAPMSAAATPDPNAPSSLDALMKTISTAVTRPRSSSGVTSGRIVWRRTTLTMSTAPPTARARSESHIVSERPKTIIVAP